MSGLFGAVTSGNCQRDLFYGTDYQSHMGTKSAGIAVRNRGGFLKAIHSITDIPFRARFKNDPDFVRMNGRMGIGVISDFDPQPLIPTLRFGDYAMAVSGLVNNQRKLISQFVSDGQVFLERSEGHYNMVELLATLINGGSDLVNGFEKTWSTIHGSASVLLLGKEGLIAARDSRGRTPLVIGRKKEAVAVASETCAFPNLGYEIERFLGPGEIVRITPEGTIETLREAGKMERLCAFLFVYTSNPASMIAPRITAALARIRSGQAMASEEDCEMQAVFGVPDSGLFHAYGFAKALGLPVVQLLVKYPTWARSYTPLTQQEREFTAHMKLIEISGLADYYVFHSIALLENSIVRATQLARTTIPKVYRAGVKEINVRPDCPPLRWTCPFIRSTRRQKDLAARRAILEIEGTMPGELKAYLDIESRKYKKMVEIIRKSLNVATLRYLRLPSMISAIGLPAESLCTYCWTGQEV